MQEAVFSQLTEKTNCASLRDHKTEFDVSRPGYPPFTSKLHVCRLRCSYPDYYTHTQPLENNGHRSAACTRGGISFVRKPTIKLCAPPPRFNGRSKEDMTKR
ncbi:hypothetical protein BaRGS_00028468 [Batillaria attramentaria]|uniref:Uncharacterized protein n=1 Tax=Batillaria attramentaria TaxID=370345 RepID=A0ABD0JZX8_9CAEN